MYVENTEFVLKFKQIFWKKRKILATWGEFAYISKENSMNLPLIMSNLPFFFCVLEGIIM